MVNLHLFIYSWRKAVSAAFRWYLKICLQVFEVMDFEFDILQNLMILYMQNGQPKGVQCVDGLKTGITIRLWYVTGN
jgi:hypothetical protein